MVSLFLWLGLVYRLITAVLVWLRRSTSWSSVRLQILAAPVMTAPIMSAPVMNASGLGWVGLRAGREGRVIEH